MKPRTTNAYYRGIEASQVLKILCPKKIGPLIGWIEDHLAPYETIFIGQWTGDLFYVEVRDERLVLGPGDGAARISVGFSVDIKHDAIYWNQQKRNGTSSGNCYVRGLKWKRLLLKPLPFVDGGPLWLGGSHEQCDVVVYRPHPIPKKEKVQKVDLHFIQVPTPD